MTPTRPPLSRATTSANTTTSLSSVQSSDDSQYQRSSSAPPEAAPGAQGSGGLVGSAVEEEEEEEFDEEDARRMSPRRNSEELERIGVEARHLLEEDARALQSGLQQLLDRVDKVKEEHERLDHENRFLQEYIGSLMATSRVTAGSGSISNQGGRVR